MPVREEAAGNVHPHITAIAVPLVTRKYVTQPKPIRLGGHKILKPQSDCKSFSEMQGVDAVWLCLFDPSPMFWFDKPAQWIAQMSFAA